ncbi:MAG: DNA/RNA nuclease SfsA [Nitrospinota bacterium]
MRTLANGVEGVFLRRLNRFRTDARVGRRILAVHVANSGRLRELLFSGNRVLLLPAGKAGRKTSHDLFLAGRPGGRGWVCMDARVPNQLAREALGAGCLPGFQGYTDVLPEHRISGGRVDFCLKGEDLPPCLLETKSVTLVLDGVAMFPDAPTLRGARHLSRLKEHVLNGGRAAVFFIVLRSDAKAFSPNDANDPAFGRALREAASAGVRIEAFKCRVSKREIQILKEIPVRFVGGAF